MPVRIAPPPESSLPKPREEDRYVPPAPRPDAEPLFSAIVPACNEAEGIEEAVGSLLSAFEEVGEPFEILLVDDGSRDATPALADALAARDPRVRVFHHGRNRGLGAAIRTGVQSARGTFIVGSPADSPLDAAQIRRFHETMEPQAAFAYLPGSRACDIAVGFRPARAGYRPWTRFMSWGYRWMLRLMFRMWLRDFNWICMYRREALERVAFTRDDFVALPEILIKAKRAGLRLVSVPCPMRARRTGRASVGRPRMLWTVLTGTLALWSEVTFRRP